MKPNRFTSILLILILVPNILYAVLPREHKIVVIDSLLNLSQKASFDVDVENIIKYGVLALSESDNISYDKGVISASNLIGQAMYSTGNYKEALRYFSLAENVKAISDYPLSLSQVYKTRAQIYFKLGMTDYSMEKLHSSLGIAQNITNDDNRYFIISQLFEVFVDLHDQLNNKDSVELYIHKNLQIIDLMDIDKSYPAKINLLTLLAAKNIEEGDIEEGAVLLDQAESLIHKYNYAYSASTLKIRGDIFMYMNKPDSALSYYLLAEQNLLITELTSELPSIYSSISDAYESLGNIDLIREYKDKRFVIERESMRETLSASGLALETLLREESAVIKRKNKRVISIIILIVAVCVLSLIVFIVFKYIKKETSGIPVEELIVIAHEDEQRFNKKFIKTYPQLYSVLSGAYPNLTDSELSLCFLSFLDIPTKDIAKIYKIEYRSVQTKRSRLRKKMNVPTEANFVEFLNQLLN